VTHTYADNGVYSATLTVTDDSGAAATDTVAVTILNANPLADAGPDRAVNEGVQFDLTGTASDPGTADVLSFAWDFSFDGSDFHEEATGPSVNWTYPDGPATYVVALRVRDDDYPYPTNGGGEVGESIDTLQVTVNNVPPIAEAGGPYTGVEGQPIVLSGTAVDVPADALTYEWDLDDDGTFDVAGQTVTTAWNKAGVYKVTLRVTDDDGGIGLDEVLVTVSNAPPTAEAGGPYSGDEGSPIQLIGTGTDPAGDPLTYAWDLDYDGVFETPGQKVIYAWPDDGVYTVTLRVDDGQGGVATDDAIVTVNNVPPIAEAGGPYTGVEGQPIALSGTAVDVPADTLAYEWDLDDDGTFDVTGQTVTAAWNKAGVYTVTLRVTDDDGGIGLDEAWVTVGNAPPTAEAGGPYSGDECSPIQLVGAGTDPAGDPLTYAWDLDYDGVFETLGQEVVHTWPDDGVYTVTLRVDDGQGGTATDDAIVTVNNVPPIAKAGSPYAATVGTPVTLIGSGTDVPSDTLTYTWYLEDNNGTSKIHGQVVTYTWMTAGTYIVKLRVEDDDGGVTTDATTVDVTP
jgi:PKD repeat protein